METNATIVNAPQIELSPETSAATAAEGGEAASKNNQNLLYPACVLKRQDGLYVDAARAALDTQFNRFVDSVFNTEHYLPDLNYLNLSQLLNPATDPNTTKIELLKLSNYPTEFPATRRALYKTVKITGEAERAEYLFEPVFLESTENTSPSTPAEPTKLNFDEFVAYLWLQGVRIGIHETNVRHAIDQNEMGLIEIAKWIEPSAGQDATIKEVSDALHRDNSPKRLANGQIDLGQFSNRYPQVAKNTALIKKIPRVLGKAGRNVAGEPLDPGLPIDIDFKLLAGAGTHVEQRPDGEYVVSSMDGFLSISSSSNQLSVADKIVSYEGVSMRTTGDLTLTGDDYEEHGEVEELRTVEGKNMTFFANVYGNLISRSGTIMLKENFSKGKMRNPQGKIIVEGRASSALIEAPGGEIRIRTAENCTITGKHVIVENAICCQIVAETLEIGIAEGCAAAAKTVKIAQSGARKDIEAVVSLFIPDLSDFDLQRTLFKKNITEHLTGQKRLEGDLETLKAQPDFAHFLVLQTKIARGEIKLSPEQQDGFKKAASRFTSQLEQLRQLSEKLKLSQAYISQAEQQLQKIDAQQAAGTQEVRCDIDAINDETVVRTMRVKFGGDFLAGATAQELAVALRHLGEPNERLFSGTKGTFSWVYSVAQSS